MKMHRLSSRVQMIISMLWSRIEYEIAPTFSICQPFYPFCWKRVNCTGFVCDRYGHGVKQGVLDKLHELFYAGARASPFPNRRPSHFAPPFEELLKKEKNDHAECGIALREMQQKVRHQASRGPLLLRGAPAGGVPGADGLPQHPAQEDPFSSGEIPGVLPFCGL